MSKSCTACGNAINTLEYMECMKCKRLYDILCLNISKDTWKKFTQKQKTAWVCPSCTSSLPKGDNSHTPVRHNVSSNPAEQADGRENVTVSRGSRGNKVSSQSSDNTANINEILLEIKKMREQVGEIPALRKEISDLRSQLLSINTTLTETLFDYKKRLDDANREISGLKCIVLQTQRDLEVQEQIAVNDEIEIIGVPETDGENLIGILNAITLQAGVELKELDVNYVTRVGPKFTSKTKIDRENKPRPIVAKLVRRLKKSEIIKACRSKPKLTTEGVSAGSPRAVYINERLTRNNRQLFRETKLRAKRHNFKFCWIRNGSVFVREAENKPAIRIENFEELDVRIGAGNTTSEAC